VWESGCRGGQLAQGERREACRLQPWPACWSAATARCAVMCAARARDRERGAAAQKGRDRSGGHCVRRGGRDAPLRPYGIGPIVARFSPQPRQRAIGERLLTERAAAWPAGAEGRGLNSRPSPGSPGKGGKGGSIPPMPASSVGPHRIPSKSWPNPSMLNPSSSWSLSGSGPGVGGSPGLSGSDPRGHTEGRCPRARGSSLRGLQSQRG
jgi:hypothetical protein